MKLTKANRLSHREALTVDFALIVLCLGALMIVLDTTIVNVALPSIRQDLGFSETSLAWVVNAYLLTFGSFLLLGGRLGDLFGHRKLFLNLFTEPVERAKAMGFFGFVAAGGGSIGVLLGGVLTNALNWHWVFLVNLPVGIAVVALSLILLPPGRGPAAAASQVPSPSPRRSCLPSTPSSMATRWVGHPAKPSVYSLRRQCCSHFSSASKRECAHRSCH